MFLLMMLPCHYFCTRKKSFFFLFREFIILWSLGDDGWFRSFRIFQYVNRAKIGARENSFFILYDGSDKKGKQKKKKKRRRRRCA